MYSDNLIENIVKGTIKNNDFIDHNSGIKIYWDSFSEFKDTKFFMIKKNIEKLLIVYGKGELFNELAGEENNFCKICSLTHKNRLVLNKYLDYTNPIAFGRNSATIGLGDRLGIAAPGHISSIRDKSIKPVLAQQSIRELMLTGRTYEDVLDAVCYAIIQQGYKGGFGADGDHLKEENDIQKALELGFSMVTLDCSEKIDDSFNSLSPVEIREMYNRIDCKERKRFEEIYLNKTFYCSDCMITYTPDSLISTVLIYYKSLEFILNVYKKYIKDIGRKIDYEVSFDETILPTSYEAHYFIANELCIKNVEINSLAPRFVGEFQKGIDYIGNIDEFEENIKMHCCIADKFGYKLSIHSGSDKFSIYPLIGKYTKFRFHIKTAGTSWLEAVRLIAEKNPSLYRRMHEHALANFSAAKKYYSVSTDINAIQPLRDISDKDLVKYMDDKNARQLMHITYGILLQAKNCNGELLFKDELYNTMNEFEKEYSDALYMHLEKHINLIFKDGSIQ
jgi:tagaturonate epimerase